MLTDFLAKVISCNELTGGTYAEPFCGGAGAAINLLLMGHVSKIILNDIDPAIYAFWFSILNFTDEFIKKIEATPVSIEEWHRQRDVVNKESNDLLASGFAFFFLNRCNRSGILRANPIGGLKQSGKWKIDARFNKKELVKKIEKIASKKDNIQIENKNALTFLQDIAFAHKKKLFIYLDPPYYKQGPALYLNALAPENHIDLATTLEKETFHSWLVTYDNTQEIRRMYPKSTIKNFTLNYSAHLHKKGEEILIHPQHTQLPNDAIRPSYGLSSFEMVLSAQ